MDNSDLKSLLAQRIALLTGGRDRNGGPVIIFPSHGEFAFFSVTEISTVLRYLIEIPDATDSSRGVTIIIDCRNGPLRHLRNILTSVKQTCSGRLLQILVIKPDQFLEQKKLFIEMKLDHQQSIQPTIISISKLGRYVDTSFLPTTLSGNYPYDHEKWLDLRLRYEAFVREGSVILQNVSQWREELKSMTKTQENIHIHPDLPEKTAQFLETGKQMLNEVKDEVEVGRLKLVNRDWKTAANRVETLLKEVKEKTSDFEDFRVRTTKEHSDMTTYYQFNSQATSLINWILGPGEKMLLEIHEIGESVEEAELLSKQHDNLLIKAEEVFNDGRELKNLADDIITAGHPHSAEIQKKRNHLDEMTKTFALRAKRQKDIVRMSVRFHKLVDQFADNIEEILENLSSEVFSNDVSSAEVAIQMLDVRIGAISRAYIEVMDEGKNFLDLLSQTELNCHKHEVTRDYLPGIVHVKGILADVEDRNNRCNDLSDMRRLKLQQILQVFTYEKDAKQALKWLHELLDTLVIQHNRIGTTADEFDELKKEMIKLEGTARTTYDYVRQLLQSSLLLRHSCQLNTAVVHELSQKNEDLWAKFCRAYSERTSRLNISLVFFNTVKQVNDRLEDLCTKVKPEMASDRGVKPSDIRRYQSLKRQTVEEVRELKHMATELVQRITQPVISTSTDKYRGDDHGVREIQDRLSQVEQKQSQLDSFWTDPVHLMVKDLSVSGLHVSSH